MTIVATSAVVQSDNSVFCAICCAVATMAIVADTIISAGII